jgi:hypothetical protein
MVAAIIDEGRPAFMINLRLRVVNLRCGGRQCHKGATLSTCRRKLTRFWDEPCSSACVLRDESCLETF